MINVFIQSLADTARPRFKNPSRVLARADRATAEWYRRGYFWMRRRIFPATFQLFIADRTEPETRVLANALHLIGDHCLLNHAPMAASQLYTTSAALKPGDPSVYEDLARELCFLGEVESLGSLNMVVQRMGLSDLVDMEGELELLDDEGGGAVEVDCCWRARECIAMGFPRLALQELAASEDSPTLLHRAQAWGSLNRSEKVMGVWEAISKRNDSIETSSADVYFLPESTWNSTAFWECIRGCIPRFTSAFLFDHDLMREQMGNDASLTEYQRDEWAIREHVRFQVEMELARTTGDAKTVGLLAKRFPSWARVQCVPNEMS